MSELDVEQLAEHLRHRLPERPALQVSELWRSPGGMSRQTWFADVAWEGADGPGAQRLTIRIDHEDGSVVPTPLWWEYRVMKSLYGSSVPVAEPLWYEEDPRWFGRDFYVRDCVPGDASPKPLFAPGGDERRAKIGRRLAELLAEIHIFDWEKGGLAEFMAVPRQPRDAALLELANYRRHWDANAPEPMPVLAELFAWLDRNAPTHVPRVSLVWGDVGVGNFIYSGDEIVALTDWEQAHLGDPMKDLAAALWRGIESIISKDELYSIYEARSGIEICEESIEYYHVFIDAQYATMSGSVLRGFAQEKAPDITFARLGLGIPYRCLDLGLRGVGR